MCERTVIIPGLAQLTTRHAVLAGYTAQAELMAKQNMTPRDFAHKFARLADKAVDGFLIL